jgi:hypothetical protein
MCCMKGWFGSSVLSGADGVARDSCPRCLGGSGLLVAIYISPSVHRARVGSSDQGL